MSSSSSSSSSAQHGLSEFMCLLDSIEHSDSDRGPSSLIEKVKEIQAVYPEWNPLETVDDNVGATALHHLVGVRKGDAEDYEEEDGAGEMMMMMISESDQQLLEIYHMFVMPKAASVPTLSKFLLEFPRDASGESLLHYAARGGRVGLVDALIKDATAALTASSANGAGDEQTAESLARKLITAPDEDSGATPFHFAAKGGHVGVLQLFMKYDAYCAPHANEKFLARARVAAKVMEESSSSRVAEESFPTPLFLVKDKEGMSSAQYAAGSGNVATMRFLADKGAKVLLERVSFAGSEDRTTHCEGADVPESEKKKSDEKENDIDQFIRESVDFLFLKDAEGTTTLHMAAFSGSIEMLEMIVNEASSLGAEGTTNTEQNVIAATCPLLTASSNGRVPEGGPLADARGQTPLHFATMAGAGEEVIDYLLSLKAALPLHSPSSSSNVGSVATDTTVTSSSPLAVAVVVFAINVSAATASDQMTALHYAAANGDEQIMERLLRGRAEEEEENTDEKKTKKEGGGDVGVINYYHRANPNLANSEGMTANDILAEGEEQQEQEGCCVNHPYHHDHDACCDGGNSHSH